MIEERDTRDLLRRLCGELDAEQRRRLEARISAEPELRAAAEELERSWRGLEPPTEVAPPGFAEDVMTRISAAEPDLPAWTRLAAAAALVAGIGLGIGIGRVPPEETVPYELTGPAVPTLADSYFAALEELDEGVTE